VEQRTEDRMERCRGDPLPPIRVRSKCSREDGDREEDRSGEQEPLAETAQHQALEAEGKPVAHPRVQDDGVPNEKKGRRK